jgi:uncharacterized protein YecE (DUF72 family)
MPNVYAGASGWAYSSWKPDFYPAKLASAKFLSYYATRLNSVEVNYTFRSFPTDKLLRRWSDATPAGFKFAIKAHQSITHVKRLRGAGESTAKFLISLEHLKKEGKLGPVLFQLPQHLNCDVSLLMEFLAESWFTEEVFAALRKRNVALCHAENEGIQTPPVQTADFFYLRLRKDEYYAKSLRELIQRVTDLHRRGEVFAYFKHEETPKAAFRGEALLAAINAG